MRIVLAKLRPGSSEQILVADVPHAGLNDIAWEVSWRGVGTLTAYTLDRQTYTITVSEFIRVEALQKVMGLPIGNVRVPNPSRSS